MIVYPKDWKKDYSVYANTSVTVEHINRNNYIDFILDNLKNTLKEINIKNLAYSGGIDSTIILALMSDIFPTVNTYTISSRPNHPDIIHAKIGSIKYNTNHTTILVEPTYRKSDVYEGDNAVRMFFEYCKDDIICCDGIDEFMCGYYNHQKDPERYYKKYLSELLPYHLIPLNRNSKKIKVYLPYLNKELIEFLSQIDINKKVDQITRKKIMIDIGIKLDIPIEIIQRNKYGFIDAFKEIYK